MIQTGSEVQPDRVNISMANGPTYSRETTPWSDSGVHSWTEQWENMSENSTHSSSGQTVGSHREGSGRVPQMEYRAPPNTEEEEDSDCLWTDGLLLRKLGGGLSEVMYGEDGRFPYSAVTGGGSGRNADIAALSDFSDDSAELGVRQQLEYRATVPVQPILPAEDDTPILCDPPVNDDSSGQEPFFRGLPIKRSLLRWDKGVLLGIDDPEFASCAKRMLAKATARDSDPLLDKSYPEFVQCMAKCIRISRNTWNDHDARLREQGTDCTAPGCQCRRRARAVFPIFANGLETVESTSAKSTDRNERTCVMESSDSDSEDEVPGTYMPPLQRKRSRKYASLRTHETEVEDYFSDSSAEEDWFDRTSYS